MQPDLPASASFTLRMSIDAPAHLPLTCREVVNQIDMLISILDRLDGEPDIELGGDEEPYLGWVADGADRNCATDDREDDAGDGCEPDEDREWSLGSHLNVNQAGWSMGAGGDLADGRL